MDAPIQAAPVADTRLRRAGRVLWGLRWRLLATGLGAGIAWACKHWLPPECEDFCKALAKAADLAVGG